MSEFVRSFVCPYYCRLHLTSMCIIVYKHWPDTRKSITRTVELWNRWLILSWYYNRVYITCLLYTYV